MVAEVNSTFTEKVKRAEIDFILGRRIDDEPAQPSLWGLALSGGGIRSATFSLGVLQVLARNGLLGCFHYQSTISGGGYAGAFVQGLISRSGFDRAFEVLQSSIRDDPDSRPAGDSEADPYHPILHLREYSNYLSPRKSPLSGDALGMLGTYLRNVLLVQIQLCALLLALSMLPLFFYPWFAECAAYRPAVFMVAGGVFGIVAAILIGWVTTQANRVRASETWPRVSVCGGRKSSAAQSPTTAAPVLRQQGSALAGRRAYRRARDVRARGFRDVRRGGLVGNEQETLRAPVSRRRCRERTPSWLGARSEDHRVRRGVLFRALDDLARNRLECIAKEACRGRRGLALPTRQARRAIRHREYPVVLHRGARTRRDTTRDVRLARLARTLAGDDSGTELRADRAHGHRRRAYRFCRSGAQRPAPRSVGAHRRQGDRFRRRRRRACHGGRDLWTALSALRSFSRHHLGQDDRLDRRRRLARDIGVWPSRRIQPARRWRSAQACAFCRSRRRHRAVAVPARPPRPDQQRGAEDPRDGRCDPGGRGSGRIRRSRQLLLRFADDRFDAQRRDCADRARSRDSGLASVRIHGRPQRIQHERVLPQSHRAVLSRREQSEAHAGTDHELRSERRSRARRRRRRSARRNGSEAALSARRRGAQPRRHQTARLAGSKGSVVLLYARLLRIRAATFSPRRMPGRRCDGGGRGDDVTRRARPRRSKPIRSRRR